MWESYSLRTLKNTLKEIEREDLSWVYVLLK